MNNEIEHKFLGEIANVIVGIPEEREPVEANYEYNYIQPSHLLDFNQITRGEKVYRSSKLSESALVSHDDILIKRLSPSNVHILTVEYPDTFVSVNVLIVRVKKGINAKYIASILETQGLPNLPHNTKRGIAVQTISKSELQQLKIPLLPPDKQMVLGEIWLLSKEKQRLLRNLALEEDKYIRSIFAKVLN